MQAVSECSLSYHLLPLHRLVLSRIEKGCKGKKKKKKPNKSCSLELEQTVALAF